MIAIFSLSHPDPRQKLTHAGFSTSRKSLVVVSNESWLIFEKTRFMSYMWLIYMRYAYITNQNFTAIFLPTIFFRNHPRKILKIDFLRNAWAIFFFVFKFGYNAKFRVK